MPISISTFLKPVGANTFFLLEDKYMRGGLQVVPNITDRDAINPLNRKSGMMVVTQDTKRLYQLQDDLLSWEEFQPGGASGLRQVATHTVNNIAPLEFADFFLELGATILVYELAVDVACKVEVFETALRNDTNPFIFVATPDHLIDDGSSVLSDGSILRGRRYHIWANTEEPISNNLYFRITNLDEVNTINVTMSVYYKPLEY